MQQHTVSVGEVYLYLQENGVATADQIASGIGLRVGTVRKNLWILSKEGIVEGKGKPKQYQLTVNPNRSIVNELESYRTLAIACRRLRGIEPF